MPVPDFRVDGGHVVEEPVEAIHVDLRPGASTVGAVVEGRARVAEAGEGPPDVRIPPAVLAQAVDDEERGPRRAFGRPAPKVEGQSVGRDDVSLLVSGLDPGLPGT